MPYDLNQIQADDAAYAKQAAAAKTQEQQPPQETSWWQRFSADVGHANLSMIDSAVSDAEQLWKSPVGRAGRDVVAGATTGVVDTAQSAVDFGSSVAKNFVDSRGGLVNPQVNEVPPEQQRRLDALDPPTSPIWDHAKAAVLDFRDAVAVKDPTLKDNLIQGAAQLIPSYLGFSRALAGLHGIANIAASGALADSTALDPHAMRMGDVLALGRQAEGKLGETLRALGGVPGVNAYINYLTDRSDESEAEGRFKNVLDGFGVNMIATPLLGAVGSVLKQGTRGLRYLIDNGVGSAGDIAGIKSPASQRGAVGDDLSGQSWTAVEPKDWYRVDPNKGVVFHPAIEKELNKFWDDPMFRAQRDRDAEFARRDATANNASGESSASQEAQNWARAREAAGVTRYRLDPDGRPSVLPGIEGRDPRSITGHPIVDVDASGNTDLIDRGNLSDLAAKGLVNRAKTLHGFGKEKPGA